MSAPQLQYDSSSPYHIFAVITPVSADAIACLDVHHNASYVAPRGDAITSLRLRLDFQSIFGRPSLSFGSSYRDNVLLRSAGTSDGDGIEARHFAIHFEMQTGLLLLTDTSGTGTWISDEATLSSTLLRSTTYPLTRPTIIVLGHRRQFRFMVTMTDYINSPSFNDLFRFYARSINTPSPSFVRPFCTSGSRLAVIRGASDYFRLHKIHKSCSGTVHLCLRMSGSSLFAVKTFAKSSMKNARNQVRVLQRTRHVSSSHSR